MDLQIESRDIEMAPRWASEIEARFRSLQEGHGNLVHGRMSLGKNLHHRKAAAVAEAVVVVTVAGGGTVTARKHQKTFEEAIRAAFHAVGRELRRIREKRGAHAPGEAPPEPLIGVVGEVVKDKGFGFLVAEDGGRVYFHRNAVHDLDFDALDEGIEVSFNQEEGRDGPQATMVRPKPPVGIQ